jgi:hypothetical protein
MSKEDAKPEISRVVAYPSVAGHPHWIARRKANFPPGLAVKFRPVPTISWQRSSSKK